MRKKKIYVVGYDEDERRIFGESDDNGIKTNCYPVSAFKAKQMLKKFITSNSTEKVIYRLVKVDPKEI